MTEPTRPTAPRPDQPTIATRTFRLWTWMRQRADLAEKGMYGMEESPTAPHKADDRLPWGDPINQFGVVWLDKEHTRPQRVIDGDGCTAAVIGIEGRSDD